MDNPASQQSQASSYIQTQFFFYMLTCYYAIFAFLYRYNVITKQPPQINVNRLPGQFLIQCLQNQPQFVPGVKDNPIPASYTIKSKLCILNSYLYLFMMIFSLIGTQDIFYACTYRQYGIIYIFGFIAWTLAAVVLRRQYQRKINQSLWTHRIFWIFSGTFAVTKMFQDYLLPLNLILNCISIGTNFILATYGIYRPQDNDTLTLIDNEDIPGIVKIFFQYIQLNPHIRKILKIQQPTSQAINQPIDTQNLNLGQIDINTLQQAFKITTQSRRQQINILNQLPRRNIFIDKKLQYIKNPNGLIKVYYFIFTQIGNNRFEISRTYKQFIKLQQDLFQIFNQKNFPKIVLPKLKKSQMSQNLNQSDVLEQWLVQLTKKPLFMVKCLLNFLNINQQSSAPFLTYFDVSYKSFCSNTFMLAQLKKKQANKGNRVSLVGYYDQDNQITTNSSVNRIGYLIKQKLQFNIQIDQQITDIKQYGFIFTCIRQQKHPKQKQKTKQKIKWKLCKYQQNILQLNYRIQQQCKISIPFYYQIISTLNTKNHKIKAKAFCQYIQKLLNQEKYYCVSLFQFIRFDPITVQVKISGIDVSLKKKQSDHQKKRLSHYFQQYQDHHQNFITILRVDRIDSQKQQNINYKFQIRRKSFVLFRTSEEIIKLRKDLAEIYNGVCFVPIISYQNCNKYQAKQRTQKFLITLETLPKILINQSFASFYFHTL